MCRHVRESDSGQSREGRGRSDNKPDRIECTHNVAGHRAGLVRGRSRSRVEGRAVQSGPREPQVRCRAVRRGGECSDRHTAPQTVAPSAWREGRVGWLGRRALDECCRSGAALDRVRRALCARDLRTHPSLIH